MVSWRFVASHPIATKFLNFFLSLRAPSSSLSLHFWENNLPLPSFTPCAPFLAPSLWDRGACILAPLLLPNPECRTSLLPPPLCSHSPLVEAVILSSHEGSRGEASPHLFLPSTSPASAAYSLCAQPPRTNFLPNQGLSCSFCLTYLSPHPSLLLGWVSVLIFSVSPNGVEWGGLPRHGSGSPHSSCVLLGELICPVASCGATQSPHLQLLLDPRGDGDSNLPTSWELG